jgi:hypothetical protein
MVPVGLVPPERVALSLRVGAEVARENAMGVGLVAIEVNGMTVKVSLVESPPADAVTRVWPAGAPAGTVASFIVKEPVESATAEPSGEAPKVMLTVAPAGKLEPVTVKVLPATPELGVSAIWGGMTTVKRALPESPVEPCAPMVTGPGARGGALTFVVKSPLVELVARPRKCVGSE